MKSEFDKLLLAFILLILLGVIVAHLGDHDTNQFLETTASGFAGALLGLITNRYMQKDAKNVKESDDAGTDKTST